jgi:hypothetical protein
MVLTQMTGEYPNFLQAKQIKTEYVFGTLFVYYHQSLILYK